MIFQSLAPQFNFKTALKHLTVRGSEKDSQNLKDYLTKEYQGHSVELYAKGRTALAEAIRIGTSGEGRVIVTSLTCYAVEQAVVAAGCRPVFLDITYKNLQYSKKALDKAFEDFEDIKAIVVQNTLGIPANINLIKSIAKEKNIIIIEDMAHSVGSKYLDGTKMGTVGDITMFSFGRDKAVDVTNGGAVVLRSEFNHRLRKPTKSVSKKQQSRDRIYPLFARTARFLYPIGLGRVLIMIFYKMKWAIKSSAGEVDFELKMPNWQARLALEKLQDLPKTIKHRQEITKAILKEVHLTPIKGVESPDVSLIRVPFVVENRHEVMRALKSAGIFIEDAWYDSPVSPRRYMKNSLFVKSEAPNAIKISNEIINIPTYTSITKHDIDAMAIIINRTAEDAKR